MSLFKLNTNVPFLDQLTQLNDLEQTTLVDIDGIQLKLNDAKDFVENSFAPNNKVESLKENFINTANTSRKELTEDQLDDFSEATGLDKTEVNNVYKNYYIPTLNNTNTDFNKRIETSPLKEKNVNGIIDTLNKEPTAAVRNLLNSLEPESNIGFVPVSTSTPVNTDDELLKRWQEEQNIKQKELATVKEKEQGNKFSNLLQSTFAGAASTIGNVELAMSKLYRKGENITGIPFPKLAQYSNAGVLTGPMIGTKEGEFFLESILNAHEKVAAKDPENAGLYGAGHFVGLILDPAALKLFQIGYTEKIKKGLFKTDTFADKFLTTGVYGAIGGSLYGLAQTSPEIVDLEMRDEDFTDVGLFAGSGFLLAPILNRNIPIRQAFGAYKDRLREKIGGSELAQTVRESETIQQAVRAAQPSVQKLKEGYGKTVKTLQPIKDIYGTLTDPIKDFWTNTVGKRTWDLISRNAISIPTTAGGAITAASLTPDDATMMEKFTVGAMGAAAGFALGKTKLGASEQSLDSIVGNAIMHDYLIPAELKSIKQWASANTKQFSQRFANIVRQVKNIEDPEIQKQLYRIIAGEVDRRSTPKELKEVSKEAIELIKDVGQKMVDAGLLSPEVYKQNAGKYLHRTYAKHLAEQVGKNNYRNASVFRIIGDALRPRGITLDVTKKQYEKTFKAQGFKILEETPKQKITVTMGEFNKTFKSRGFEILATTGSGKSKKVIIGKPELKIRRDYTKDERAILGEIENASFAIAETGRLMTNDLTMAEMFRNIAANPNIALSESKFARSQAGASRFKGSPKETWVQVPTTKIPQTNLSRYGNLAGYYVPREVYTDLWSMTNYKNFSANNPLGAKFTDAYRQALSLWKRSKTAWNPAVHMNNTMSNVMLYDFADANYSYIPQAMRILAGQEHNDLYILAERFGVFDGGFVKNELHDFTGDLRKGLTQLAEDAKSSAFNPADSSLNYANRMAKYGAIGLDKLGIKESGSYGLSGAGAIIGYLNSDDDDSLMEHIENMAYGAAGGFALGKTKLGESLYRNTLGKLEDMYQYEDQVFRMGIFLDRLGRGLKVDKAALDAKKWMIDYNINSPFINTLRYTATPFLSYTYRVVPLLAETTVKKPWKVGKWSGIAYGLNKIGSSFGYGDEEYEREIGDDRMRNTLWGVPNMPYTKVKTPFIGEKRGVKGNVQPLYLDASRWVPGGDVFSLDGATGAEPLLKGLPAPFNPSFGLAGEIVTPYLGIDNFTWTKLKGLGLSDEKDAEIKRAHFLSKITPNFPLPFVTDSYSSAKIEQALTDNRDPLQIRFSPTEAVLNTLGIKVEPFDTERQKAFRAFEVNKKVDAYKENVRELAKKLNRGKITQEEYYNEVKKLETILKNEIEPIVERLKKHVGGLVGDNVAQVVDRPDERGSKYLQGQSFAEVAGDIISYNTEYEREKFNRGGRIGFLQNLKDNFKQSYLKTVNSEKEIDDGFNALEEFLNSKPSYSRLKEDLETLNIPTDVSPVFGKTLSSAKDREAARLNFIKDSVVKDEVYRAELNNDIKDTLYSFALPREMGAHFGNQYQANNIMFKRTINDKEVFQDLLPTIYPKMKGDTRGQVSLSAQQLDHAISKLWENVFKGPELIDKYVGKGMSREELKELVLASTVAVKNSKFTPMVQKVNKLIDFEDELIDIDRALPYLKTVAERAKSKYGFDVKTDGEDMLRYLMIANDRGLQGQAGRKAPVMLKGHINIKKPLVIEDEGLIQGWSPNFFFEQHGKYPQLKQSVIDGIRNVVGRDLTKEELSVAKDVWSNNMFTLRKHESVLNEMKKIGLENFARDLSTYKLPYAKFGKDMQDYLNHFFKIDGIKYGNALETTPSGMDHYSYIAFKPEQFKTFNSLKFDKRDIRHHFAKGGEVDE